MTRVVYAIRSDAGPIKIGISKSPRDRLATLLFQQPFGAEIIHTLIADDGIARTIEAAAHQLLAAKQKRGEWFDVSADEAITAITDAAALVERGDYAKKPAAGSALERVHMVMPVALLDRIDRWRRKQPDIPNKSEAIRLLIEAALKADDA